MERLNLNVIRAKRGDRVVITGSVLSRLDFRSASVCVYLNPHHGVEAGEGTLTSECIRISTVEVVGPREVAFTLPEIHAARYSVLVAPVTAGPRSPVAMASSFPLTLEINASIEPPEVLKTSLIDSPFPELVPPNLVGKPYPEEIIEEVPPADVVQVPGVESPPQEPRTTVTGEDLEKAPQEEFGDEEIPEEIPPEEPPPPPREELRPRTPLCDFALVPDEGVHPDLRRRLPWGRRNKPKPIGVDTADAG